MYPAWINFIPAIGSISLVVLLALGYSTYQHISKILRERHSHGRYSDLAVNAR